MIRIFALTIIVVAWSLPRHVHAQTPECLPPDPPASSQEFVDWLDCILVEFQDVWKDDIVSGILLAHPKFGAVRELELVYVSDCDFSPRLEDVDEDGHLEVVFNTRLLIPQITASQAILWYLIAPDGMVPPEAHLAYINNSLLPSVREDARACSQENVTGRYSMVPIATVFDADREAYPVFLSMDSPQVRRIGDYVGALPSFSALIHEAGHAALHLTGPQPTSALARELEADSFAADVFAANGVPSALGLAYLLLSYDLNRGGASPQIACRIVALTTRSDRRASLELGTQTLARIDSLREAYAEYYKSLCADL
ncbi:MAG: hypothetical protein OIF40_15130 [Mangrovicoccus sp.]|nr:hypothetical protein [Mangrovicoccus sp.]